MRVFFWSFVFESLDRLRNATERQARTARPAAGNTKSPIRTIHSVRGELNPEALVDLYDACKEFMRRCECREVRSIRSYSQMKAVVDKAETSRF